MREETFQRRLNEAMIYFRRLELEETENAKRRAMSEVQRHGDVRRGVE